MTSSIASPAVAAACPTETVGTAECKIAEGSILATYALGSCVAVTLHDAEIGIGALLHFKLPESSGDVERAIREPFLYADTGIRLAVNQLLAKGARKNRLRVCLVGGAQMLDSSGTFQIGKKNYLAARKVLWKEGLLVFKEAIGGDASRAVFLSTATGSVTFRLNGSAQPIVLAPPFTSGDLR